MADGASSAEDSPDDDSDLSRARTATGHRKHSSSQTQDRLWHSDKNDRQLNDCGIFLSY